MLKDWFKIEITIICSLLFTLCSCITVQPLPEMTEKEKSVLFIKEYVPDNQYNCMYKGIIQYTMADNPGGGIVACARHKRQAWFFIHQATKRDANLVVANFSRYSDDVSYVDGKPACTNEVKVFKCPQKSLIELKRYE